MGLPPNLLFHGRLQEKWLPWQLRGNIKTKWHILVRLKQLHSSYEMAYTILVLILFRGVITPLSSSYNNPGLAAGLLVTFSMLLTETSKISKRLLFGDLSADKCLN